MLFVSRRYVNKWLELVVQRKKHVVFVVIQFAEREVQRTESNAAAAPRAQHARQEHEREARVIDFARKPELLEHDLPQQLVIWVMADRDLYNYWEDWQPLKAP